MEDNKLKIEEIDPEIKKIMDNINEFMVPKFKEFQDKLSGEKPGMLKLLKIAKDFVKDAQTEYEEKFGRDFEKDIKTINDKFGYNPSDMLNMFKKMTP